MATADAVVASHARLPGSGQTSYDWQHYIELVQCKPGALRNGTPVLDLPAPLLRLRQSLLRHPGGVPVMAQVLAVVPQAGLETVLAAVELVLEGIAPSGSISVEHVRNVLARLNNPVTPEQAVKIGSAPTDQVYRTFPRDGQRRPVDEPCVFWKTLFDVACARSGNQPQGDAHRQRAQAQEEDWQGHDSGQ